MTTARTKKVVDPNSPKKTVTRKMINTKDDPFYTKPYTVIDRVSLNAFDPTENSNKFYIAELHQNAQGEFRFYANHGRVGSNGAPKAQAHSYLADAKDQFNSKVREKMSGRKGYVKVDLATVTSGSEQGKQKINADGLKGVVDTNKIASQQSNLHPKIAEFVKHIYDEANQAVSLSITGSVKSDIRAPLGNLGINGINAGRKLLNDISRAIKMNNTYFVRQASIEYYKYIPRKLPSDVRDESTWILNTDQRISKELDVLDLYEDSLRMMNVMGLSDVDSKYLALSCDVRYIDPQEELMAYIQHKIKTTHAGNHNYKLKVVNAYEVNMKNAPQFDDRCGNVVKLFHGSRSANIAGILSSYLKLPNTLSSDVGKTGAMFGDGVYFASDCTKSANYAFASFGGRANKYKTAFLMIADVAMGNVHKVTAPHHFKKPPTGFHSVMGCKGSHLINNEFIVYNPAQVRVRYIVEVEKV